MGNSQDDSSLEVNTGGGAYVGKDVTTGGDFAGRDINITHIYQQPPAATLDKATVEVGGKSRAKPSRLPSWLKLSDTIAAALIGAIATVSAAYWFSNNSRDYTDFIL